MDLPAHLEDFARKIGEGYHNAGCPERSHWLSSCTKEEKKMFGELRLRGFVEEVKRAECGDLDTLWYLLTLAGVDWIAKHVIGIDD